MIRSSASRNTIWLPTGGLSRCACSSIQREKLNAERGMPDSIFSGHAQRPAVHLQEMRLALHRAALRETPGGAALRALRELRREEPRGPHRRDAESARPAAGQVT